MSKTLNRVISICLVVALMCGIFITPIAQPKADALAITATTGMIAAGVTLLTMLGITFASTGAAEKASKGLIEGSKEIHDWVKRIIPGPSGDPDKNTLMMDAAATGGLALFVNKAKELFGNKKKSGTVDVPDPNCGYFQNVKYLSNCNLPYECGYSTDPNAQLLYGCAHYTNSMSNPIHFNVNGVDFNYWCVWDHSPESNAFVRFSKSSYLNGRPENVYVKGDNLILDVDWLKTYCDFDHWVNIRFGFFRYEKDDGSIWLYPFIAGCFINDEGKIKYTAKYSYKLVNGMRKLAIDDGYYYRYAVPLTGTTLPATTQVPYQNVSPYEMSIIYNALAEKLEKGNITIDYSDTLDQIENHSDEQLNISQEQLLEQAEIRKTLEEIKAGQGDGTTQLEEQDMDIPEAPDLTWKFPFCIPFDLIALVGALNAKPKDPKWEIPFHVESIGFDDSMELDLTKFEPVSEVLRVIITIMFLLGLIVVTRKMIKG